MKNETTQITFRGKKYAVIKISYKKAKLPLVLDWDDYKEVKKLDKNWKCHQNGFVSSRYLNNGEHKDLFIHEIVKAIDIKDKQEKLKLKPILHINRIGLDNRRKNLIYQGQKGGIRNTIKKKRSIKLPKECGVKPDEIPTYVWYLKENKTHGERFMIHIGDVSWKTTASKKVSLKTKLEDAKDYLKDLQKNRPELFEEYCMNGEYNKNGKDLLKEYYAIVKKAGFSNLSEITTENRTEKFLK